MHCLTGKEAEEVFGGVRFRVSPAHPGGGAALYLDAETTRTRFRVGCWPGGHSSRLARFADALNRWLPTNRGRLLWVEHWHDDYPNTYEAFMAVRRGTGESRSLSDVPGHCFDAHPYHDWDQLEISGPHRRDVSLLAGLMLMLMDNEWDGWLIANGEIDRIEFWEGNVFFHSSDKSRIDEAIRLMEQFGCSRDLK
jgi:hypothetical protein